MAEHTPPLIGSLSTSMAATYLGLSQKALLHLARAGNLTPRPISPRILLWDVRDLDRFLDLKTKASPYG
jgi:hypothetical protein